MRAAVLLLLVPSLAIAQPYDASELVASLRADERARSIAQAQLQNANELPLYELDVTLADDLASYTLDERLTMTNRSGRSLSEIVLRVWANATLPAGQTPPVVLTDSGCEGQRCSLRSISPSTLVVSLERPLAVGETVRLQVKLRGTLRTIDPERTTMMAQGLEGLTSLTGGGEAGDYGLLARSGGTVSLAQFYAGLARMRAGIWEQSDASTMGDLGSDELANVRATIRVPHAMHVVAVGTESAPVVEGSRDRVEVRAGLVRDFTVIAARDLESATRRVGGVRVRSFFAHDAREAGLRALETAAYALRLFARRFGSYPWTELDVVQAPLIGGAGGVEFSGLVTIASMFYRPFSAPSTSQDPLLGALLGQQSGQMEARRGPMLEFVTAHEVAHQWWHGIVGSDSRAHPFQDETLAQWSALYYVEDRYGAARAREEGEQQIAAGYHVMRMLGRPDAPVDRSVSAFGDALVYGGLVYGKGPFLYPALRSELGDAAFFAALGDYAREQRFRIAPSRALFERMARGPHADRVRALAARWLDEAHGDDDLGQPDLGRMLGMGQMDPEVQSMLRSMMGQLGGAQNGGRGGDAAGAMQGLMQMLE